MKNMRHELYDVISIIKSPLTACLIKYCLLFISGLVLVAVRVKNMCSENFRERQQLLLEETRIWLEEPFKQQVWPEEGLVCLKAGQLFPCLSLALIKDYLSPQNLPQLFTKQVL